MNEAAAELRAQIATVKLTEKNLRSFWQKVDKQGPLPDQSNPHYVGLDRCWIWTGATITKGYGLWRAGIKLLKANRASWLIHNGKIPDGIFVLHRCDNRPCVNPSHLFLGTNQDNVDDCSAKGRHARGDKSGARTKPERRPRGDQHGSKTKPQNIARGSRHGAFLHPELIARGEKSWNAKLTDEIVVEIRKRHASKLVKARTLAKEYGVLESTISKLVNRKSWKHI